MKMEQNLELLRGKKVDRKNIMRAYDLVTNIMESAVLKKREIKIVFSSSSCENSQEKEDGRKKSLAS